MSLINKTILRQTSLFYRIYHLNITQQKLLPFSTSVRYLAESTNAETSSSSGSSKDHTATRQSFDSVPVHLGPFGKIVMVLGGLYGRLSDVPDTIPNRQYQKTKDKFRARCVIVAVFGTGLLGLVAAMRGKHARKEGKRYTDEVYKMHRGESKLHEQLEALHPRRTSSERYSPPIDEVNK